MPSKNENKRGQTELTIAQRFTNAVVTSYEDVARGIDITPKQMQLISNYYIKLDTQFKSPDSKINSWGQVNMQDLSLTLAHMAKMNLDMQLSHFSFMPFFNNKSGKFNLAPVISKEGYWYIAKTFSIDPPKNFVLELVYSNDRFSVSKKDLNHEFDSYIFEIKNPFDRGKIIGGFAYLEYDDKSNNRLLVMSEEEILKYRPLKYSQNFWSGENMKKMYEKTIAKQLFKRVQLDPDKINDIQDVLQRVDAEELNFEAAESQREIEENMGNGDFIDIEYSSINDKVSNIEEKPVENVENDEYKNLIGENI